MIEAIVLFLVGILFGWKGVYSPQVDYIACIDPLVCRHEEGHRLDYQLGRPSQTEEFKSAIDEDFPILLEGTSCLIETEKCLYSEAYARLWSMIDVNKMVKRFAIFYKEAP